MGGASLTGMQEQFFTFVDSESVDGRRGFNSDDDGLRRRGIRHRQSAI